MKYSIRASEFLYRVMIPLFLFSNCAEISGTGKNKTATEEQINILDTARLAKYGEKALMFCSQKKFNTDFCFIADMSVHSGKKRFAVWNFKTKNISASGLVTHGCGANGWQTTDSKTKPVFSNIPESHCSSLGKYKIGERGYSVFGMHVKYLLYGLDSTNSNAYDRTIVLHSWEIVPDDELYPEGAPESWGCPAVSNNFMMKLDTLLSASKKPVLLWMISQ
ncbi:MAG TPA: peptidase [Bacteroidetes bacterium]|nr:peptidase [Bacteroidota bacterium]